MSDQIKVELQEFMGSDRAIANAAWTSSYEDSLKELRSEADVERVVNMLADSKHSVPFESVVLRFWMRLPIATDRQLMTHRIASHSGMSGRYRTMPNEFLDVPNDIYEINSKLNFPADIDYREICTKANDCYTQYMYGAKEAKSDGRITNDEYKRFREFMRGMLPQHNMTERTSIFNLRSFANFYKLRSKSDAQPEIRDLAIKMMNAIVENKVCPIALEALKRNNWSI